MSGKLIGEVFTLDLTPPQLIVALALADHGNDAGEHIRPGVPLIAWKCLKSRRQVQRILRSLEEIGLLVPVEGARQHQATVYRMDTSAVPRKPPPERRRTPAQGGHADVTPADPRADISASSGRTFGAVQGGHSERQGGHPDVTRTVLNPPEENRPLTVSQAKREHQHEQQPPTSATDVDAAAAIVVGGDDHAACLPSPVAEGGGRRPSPRQGAPGAPAEVRTGARTGAPFARAREGTVRTNNYTPPDPPASGGSPLEGQDDEPPVGEATALPWPDWEAKRQRFLGSEHRTVADLSDEELLAAFPGSTLEVPA